MVAAFGALAPVWAIPNCAGSNPFAQMPRELVPGIAAWIMVVRGLITAAGGLLAMLRDRVAPVSVPIDWRAIGWALWPFACVGVAVWLMTMVKITRRGPFPIAGMLWLLGERRWWMLIGGALLPVALLCVLSVHLMRLGVV